MTEPIAIWYVELKTWWHKLPSEVAVKVAWLLPKRLVYFVGIRLWAHATTGRYSSVEAGRVTVDQAIVAWEKDHRLFEYRSQRDRELAEASE